VLRTPRQLSWPSGSSWQMVLDCLGAEEALFSQGALQAFRERMVAQDMGRVLLERTVQAGP